MLITATCPNDVNQTRAFYRSNNQFLALFNEGLKILPYSKICVHSAYISHAPLITITTGLNDAFHFSFETPTISPAVSSTVNIPQGNYRPQELSDILTTLINNDIYPGYDEISVHVDFHVISGTFEFHVLFQQPVAGSTTGIRSFFIEWGNTAVTENLGRLMGFTATLSSAFPNNAINRGKEVFMNDTIAEIPMTLEGDYSINYTTLANATPVCYISIENINSKSYNNYSAQALKFLEVLRYTYPQNLNNTFILPYEKAWIQLDNDAEILLNSMEITIRNLDGTLMTNLDASKQVIIIFEVVQDLARAKEIEAMKSIRAQNKQIAEMDEMISEIIGF